METITFCLSLAIFSISGKFETSPDATFQILTPIELKTSIALNEKGDEKKNNIFFISVIF